MSRQQRVILAGLGLLLILVWSRALLSGRSRRPTQAAAPPLVAVSSVETSAAPAAAVPERWGDSPFLAERGSHGAAIGPEVHSKNTCVLNGILWDPKTPSAILNNRVVGRGDHVGEWEVSDIQKNRVVLSNGSETMTLTSSD